MSSSLRITYVVEPDPAALAWRAALHLVELIEEAVAARGRARVAVSGGSTPKATFALLADPHHPFVNRMPWDRLELFFVDERTVPPDHPDSNYRMTREALLDKVGMKPEQIHRMQGELEPEVAAAEYEFDLRRTFRLEGAEAPRFDIVTLGMGDDGHTASLFPGSPELDHALTGEALSAAATAPVPPHPRMTLTLTALLRSRLLILQLGGEAKRAVYRQALEDGPVEQLPVRALLRQSQVPVEVWLH